MQGKATQYRCNAIVYMQECLPPFLSVSHAFFRSLSLPLIVSLPVSFGYHEIYMCLYDVCSAPPFRLKSPTKYPTGRSPIHPFIHPERCIFTSGGLSFTHSNIIHLQVEGKREGEYNSKI